ncbi:uncharacterized protein si:dkey-13e3.1 [Epinephelus fuscoguttatus]|uniref:uncharacterized protein si:dkey-13e3.1 n=1 Tax=Epinephelus fuscoguttatus TaxID=293821 RepID=UPI0020D04AE6|nr:uncharacterized protein si:dkey-13e3.1 [Epinephelus fuscoguttatus]
MESTGKCITVADLYVVPTWRQPTAADPLSSLPGFPRQPYGNDCGIFMLMYALYSVLDAPYDFTMDKVGARMVHQCKKAAEWVETN